MFPELSQASIIVARILMGALFIISGLRHFPALDPIARAMEARGVPQARLMLIPGSIYQTVLGITLALGLYVIQSAVGLMAFTILASFMMLNFWDKQGAERNTAFNGILTNVAILGGLLALAATA